MLNEDAPALREQLRELPRGQDMQRFEHEWIGQETDPSKRVTNRNEAAKLDYSHYSSGEIS
jgi:hypothetical protein